MDGRAGADVRQHNLHAIVNTLRRAGTSSRAALAERLGLSRPTLTHALRELLSAGLVMELEERHAVSATGRRRTAVVLNGEAAHVLAVDIGGTKTALAIHDLHGHIRTEHVMATTTTDLTSLLRNLRSAYDQLAREAEVPSGGPVAVAVGVPGVVRSDGRIDNAPNLALLNGAPLAVQLRTLFAPGLSENDVLVENDVNLAAVGERSRGVAQAFDDFAYLALGTGLGAGVFAGGRLLRGARGYAGELGEWRFDRGSSTPLEHDLSGGGLVAWARRHGWNGANAVDLLGAARRREHAALEAVLHTLDLLAHAVAQLHTLLDVQAVVLGGGLGAALLADWPHELQAALRRHHPHPPLLLASTLSEHATLHGGAMWAVERAWQHLATVRLGSRRGSPLPLALSPTPHPATTGGQV